MELLPFTIQHPASAGNSKIFAMRRFWSRNLRLDKLGVNHRYLSVRCHALRRGLALAADKTPFLPRTGDSFFRKERSKEQFNRLLSLTPHYGVRDLVCAFIALVNNADLNCGRRLAAHPAAPENGKKMLPASKIPGGYSRPNTPALPG